MNIQPVNSTVIKKAAEYLRFGRLVAFPTETVYGLGADATNDRAVAEIFSAKGRPQFNPLIVHVCHVSMAKRFAVWNDLAEKISAAFWPGPLTFILPRTADCSISLLASAGGDTIGVRMPAHSVAHALLAEAGVPVAAPSANRSGRISPTAASHVYEELGELPAMILDGGECSVGIESTVIDLSGSGVTLLRPGFVTRDQLQEVTGMDVAVPGETQGILKSPGMLASHYAPSLPVRLNVTDPRADEALLAFGSNVPPGAKYVFNLSADGNLVEAAAHLFAGLRELDHPELYSAIAVMPLPDLGIGVAINDRLARAAAAR
ncbi:MAG TPA: L-threonylcarbamoyladenylate synthase [Rickettsiales bacterium]|nr:L-threonylcarbamoyladenylate synthase [Rickettsiales bacterium]